MQLFQPEWAKSRTQRPMTNSTSWPGWIAEPETVRSGLLSVWAMRAPMPVMMSATSDRMRQMIQPMTGIRTSPRQWPLGPTRPAAPGRDPRRPSLRTRSRRCRALELGVPGTTIKFVIHRERAKRHSRSRFSDGHARLRNLRPDGERRHGRRELGRGGGGDIGGLIVEEQAVAEPGEADHVAHRVRVVGDEGKARAAGRR